MDKEKIIEALKMIRSACNHTHCGDCPFREIDSRGGFVGCNFYNVMMTETALVGETFAPPYYWDIERLEG